MMACELPSTHVCDGCLALADSRLVIIVMQTNNFLLVCISQFLGWVTADHMSWFLPLFLHLCQTTFQSYLSHNQYCLAKVLESSFIAPLSALSCTSILGIFHYLLLPTSFYGRLAHAQKHIKINKYLKRWSIYTRVVGHYSPARPCSIQPTCNGEKRKPQESIKKLQLRKRHFRPQHSCECQFYTSLVDRKWEEREKARG